MKQNSNLQIQTELKKKKKIATRVVTDNANKKERKEAKTKCNTKKLCIAA